MELSKIRSWDGIEAIQDEVVYEVPEWPWIGSTLVFGRDPLSFLQTLAARAKVSRFHLGRLPVYLLNDVELIGDVLKSKIGEFEKSQFADELRQIIGNGLVTSDGEAWLKHRKIISPVMQRKQLEGYIPAIASAAHRYAAGLREGQRNMHDDMMTLALEIIGDVLFKANMGGCAHSVSKSLEAVTTHFHTLALGWQRILPRRLPTRARRRYRQESATLEMVVTGIIESYKRNPKAGATLLQVLLDAQQRGEIAPRQIIDEALTMFLAGHETTALAVSYALYLVAGDDCVQERLRVEVDPLGDGPLTIEDLARLPYTQAVINEAMRLYPPIWSIIRRTTKPCRLGSLALKPGDHLMIAQWTLSRNAQWFPEPEQFKPERWLDGEAPPRFAYIPFGAGMRKCIGDHFAMFEATVMLAELMRRASFARVDDVPLRLVPSVTLRPKDGIRLRVMPR